MWRIWLLFDPRRTLVALFTFLFALALADPLHPAQHRPVQLAGRPARRASRAPVEQMSPLPPAGSRRSSASTDGSGRGRHATARPLPPALR